jgi:hypothetical protein
MRLTGIARPKRSMLAAYGDAALAQGFAGMDIH